MGGLPVEVSDVVSLASSVLKFGATLYNSSKALEEFEKNVDELERTCKFWQTEAQNYGLSSDTLLRLSLNRAKERLQLEETRLKKLDRRCGCLWLWLCFASGIDFPAELGNIIAELNSSITTKWKADEDVVETLRKKAEILAKKPTFTFRKDRRYVRLPTIEKEVRDELNKEGRGDENARVVLLYGRAGSGKSSMARNLALDYKEAAIIAGDRPASSFASGCRFDHIFYLECGPSADSEAKQVELLGMLDWRTFASEKENNKDSRDVRRSLKQRLKDSRSLIIFDDVWEESFLKDMVGVCGEQMRILVTSQKKYVCGPSSGPSLREEIKFISMDDISREDSLKILKFHTGFDEKDSIPEAVEECMEDLVTKVCGHPHALASIAVAIDQAHNDEESQWENAIREYDKYLNDPLPEDGCHPVHGVQYKRSFAEAIQMKFNRLGEEERKLLVLMVMLEGPSVPQEVLQLFHAEIIASDKAEGIRSCGSFSIARKRLEDLQCIKTNHYQHVVSLHPWRGGHGEQCTGWWKFERKRLSWSIHSLDEQFIQERMPKDIAIVLETISNLPNKRQGLQKEPQVNVIKLLGLMFCKHQFRQKFSQMISCFAIILSISGSELNFILPIIALMARNVGKHWSRASQKSSDQIFLSCITKRMIHIDAAKELLASPMSRQELWTLMRCFEWDTEGSIHEDVIVGVLEIFGNLQSSSDSFAVGSLNSDHWNALLVLVSRPQLSAARSCIFWMKKFVVGLIDTLTSPSCPQERKHLSAVVLSYLVPSMYKKPFEYTEEESFNVPRIIERLCQSFRETGERKVCEEAIRALYTLACHADNNLDLKQKMISTGFHQLVGILGREEELNFERQLAARTLERLVRDNSTGRYHKGIQISAFQIDSLGDLTMKVAARESEDPWTLRDLLGLLMQIDPLKGKSMVLHSSVAFETRGNALAELGQDQDAVSDLEKARQLDPTCSTNYSILNAARTRLKDWEGLIKDYDHQIGHTGEGKYVGSHLPVYALHRNRGILRQIRGDLFGALDDLNKSLHLRPRISTLMRRAYVKFLMGDKEGVRADFEKEASRLGFDAKGNDFFYQERGVAKRMTGDFPGALKDLDKSLQLGPNDYEVLKQRGYLKFLMGDKEGAQADAKQALRYRPSGADKPGYGTGFSGCLGTSIVEFLDFRL